MIIGMFLGLIVYTLFAITIIGYGGDEMKDIEEDFFIKEKPEISSKEVLKNEEAIEWENEKKYEYMQEAQIQRNIEREQLIEEYGELGE